MESDIEEIRRLHHTYAYAFDSGDFDAFAALFEHGTLHLRGVDDPATGSAAVRRLIDRCVILYDGMPATNHLMHNLVVDVDDDGTRRASTYVQVLQGLPDFPPQTIATGSTATCCSGATVGGRSPSGSPTAACAATCRATSAGAATARRSDGRWAVVARRVGIRPLDGRRSVSCGWPPLETLGCLGSVVVTT